MSNAIYLCFYEPKGGGSYGFTLRSEMNLYLPASEESLKDAEENLLKNSGIRC